MPIYFSRVKVSLLILAVMLAGAVHAQAAFDASVTHITIAGRDVAMWKPATAAPPGGYPLIVFSHGFTGCNTQSTFLMEALARAGYLVLAPNHEDAGCGTASRQGRLASRPRPQQRFQDPKIWSDATYRDRYKDIEAVLNEALRGKSFQGLTIDRSRIGLAGHSLGGYTVLGLAGGWRSWKDPRIKAVLALSPYCTPYLDHGSLAFGVPVMFQGGTRDFGITPFVRRVDGAFDRTSAPKYYVELDGAGHFAWTNLNAKYQETIDTYSVAFFDRYLKALTPNPLTPLLTKPYGKDVSAVQAAE